MFVNRYCINGLFKVLSKKKYYSITRRHLIMGPLESHCEHTNTCLQYQQFIRLSEKTQFTQVLKEKYNEASAENILEALTPKEERLLKFINIEFDEYWESFHRNMQRPEIYTKDLVKLLSMDDQSKRTDKYKAIARGFGMKLKKERKQDLLQELIQERDFLRNQLGRCPPDDYCKTMYINDLSLTARKVSMAAMYGPQIVLDCQYIQGRNPKILNTIKRQLNFLHFHNIFSSQPFNIVFSNLNSDDTSQKLTELLQMYNEFGYTLTHKDYLDIFPKEKIIYLTTSAKEEIECFDHDAVYVVGLLVERFNPGKQTMAEVKKQSCRAVRLPLEKYVKWQKGDKNLTINQQFCILNTLKHTNDWHEALKHVPSRKGDLYH